MTSAIGGLKSAGSWALELQMVMSHSLGTGIEPGSPGRAANVLRAEPFL